MPTGDNTEEKTPSREDDKSGKEKSMRKYLQWIWYHCVKGKADAWQAICAVVLSFFTFLLYRVSDRATETSRAGERAFVNFAQPGVGVKLVGTDGKWVANEVALNWINSGNTPASNIVIQTNIQVWRASLPAGYAFPENRENALSVIGRRLCTALMAEYPRPI